MAGSFGWSCLSIPAADLFSHSTCPAPHGTRELEALSAGRKGNAKAAAWEKQAVNSGDESSWPSALPENPRQQHPLQACREAGKQASSGCLQVELLLQFLHWLSSAKDAAMHNVKLPRCLSTHEP